MSDELESVCVAGRIVTVADLRRVLANQGLALVPAADVPTPEERAALKLFDEARRARSAYLLEHPYDDFRFGKPRQFVLAELLQELVEGKS